MTASASVAAMPGHRGIGEVLAELRADFPDVTISKIRFLESEGLVEPHRTPSGYRKFSPADVERLRYILRAQRDHYLPLRVIREHLDALDRGLQPAETATAAPTVPSPSVAAADPPAVEDDLRLSRRELLQAADIDEELLQALEEHGLVRRRPAGPRGGAEYTRASLEVAMSARRLHAYGIEPRHLRGVRTAVDREADLIEQALRPRSRSGEEDHRASAVHELAGVCAALHSALLRSALRPAADEPQGTGRVR